MRYPNAGRACAIVCLTALGVLSSWGAPAARLRRGEEPHSLREARRALRRLARARSEATLADALSNRSAAAFGIKRARLVGGVLEVLDRENVPGSRRVARELTRLLHRYDAVDLRRNVPPLPAGVPFSKDGFMSVLLRTPSVPSQMSGRLRRHGRQFLTELAPVLAQCYRAGWVRFPGPKGTVPENEGTLGVPDDPGRILLTVVSPTRVDIRLRDTRGLKPGDIRSCHAIQGGGKWRIDIDPERLL